MCLFNFPTPVISPVHRYVFFSADGGTLPTYLLLLIFLTFGRQSAHYIGLPLYTSAFTVSTKPPRESHRHRAKTSQPQQKQPPPRHHHSSGGSRPINFASGFTATVLQFNGRPMNCTRLQLTDGGQAEASSAWFPTPVNVQTFKPRLPPSVSSPQLGR